MAHNPGKYRGLKYVAVPEKDLKAWAARSKARGDIVRSFEVELAKDGIRVYKTLKDSGDILYFFK